MEQAYEIASMPTGSAQLTHKQDHRHSFDHPDSAYHHILPSIHWTGPKQSLRYQNITIVAIENAMIY